MSGKFRREIAVSRMWDFAVPRMNHLRRYFFFCTRGKDTKVGRYKKKTGFIEAFRHDAWNPKI
jgi:hypothetical protein